MKNRKKHIRKHNHEIYIIQNIVNMKIYVGYSSGAKERLNTHRRDAYNIKFDGYEYPLYRAIRKYGWERFTKQVIEKWETRQEALESEKFWIEYLRTNIRVF